MKLWITLALLAIQLQQCMAGYSFNGTHCKTSTGRKHICPDQYNCCDDVRLCCFDYKRNIAPWLCMIAFVLACIAVSVLACCKFQSFGVYKKKNHLLEGDDKADLMLTNPTYHTSMEPAPAHHPSVNGGNYSTYGRSIRSVKASDRRQNGSRQPSTRTSQSSTRKPPRSRTYQPSTASRQSGSKSMSGGHGNVTLRDMISDFQTGSTMQVVSSVVSSAAIDIKDDNRSLYASSLTLDKKIPRRSEEKKSSYA